MDGAGPTLRPTGHAPSERARSRSVRPCVPRSQPPPGGICGYYDSSRALPPLHKADELLARSDTAPPLPQCSAEESLLLAQVARWAKDFLTHAHPTLGRAGPVCPYVRASLQEQLFLLTLLRSAATRQERAEQAVLRLGEYFLELEPVSGRAAQLKTIVVVFPDLQDTDAGRVVTSMHRRLKLQFLRRGMMLGEFFKENPKRGLHSEDFRPLCSDPPLLVIRAMVPSDIAFLTDDDAFVSAYLQTFKARGRAEIVSYLERRVELSSGEISRLRAQIARHDARDRGPIWPGQM